ncbi:nucleoside hydrolase [Pseudonocardia spinosispora]|uniref:nucleoside hydrolase n=1 Tax=Pseudonocardia spinosispora TaxID=103441 RepID=UPI0003FC1039|nr:nucleoside hydrolase [Pseudonocardia spinosispora]
MPSPRMPHLLAAVLAVALASASTACANQAVTIPPPAASTNASQPAAAAPAQPGAKVIFDTDFGELNDDSQALYLLLQNGVNVLGITTVSGNTWASEGAAYALRQLELENKQSIPVFEGASDPLMGSRAATLPSEAQQFGVDSSYAGAWSHPKPADYQHLAQPPYGGYAKTAKNNGNAVDFIVDTIKRNPHEVTLFVLGPATNVALAVKKNPEIVPLVKQVVYMGGAFDVPGNQGPAAEFNIWFDPEAARIAFTTPFADQLAIPLDVTDKVFYGKAEYDRITGGANTPITQAFKDLQAPEFTKDPKYRTHLWDALTSAVFLQPSLITGSVVRRVTVDTQDGVNYGRTLGFDPAHAPAGAQPVRIVQDIDIPKFYDFFVATLTRPLAP